MYRPFPKPVVRTLAGEQLTVVDSYTYLGLLIHGRPDDTKTSRMQMARLPSAKSAAYAFVATARSAGLHYYAPAYLQAMQASVVSRCTFGCQIWGPKFLHPSMHGQLKMQAVVDKTLRGLHRLPSSATLWGMYLHYGVLPIQFQMFKYAVQSWNSLLLVTSPIIAQICRLACVVANDYEHAWLAQLLQACAATSNTVGVSIPPHITTPASINWQPLAKALRLPYKQHLHQEYCTVPPMHPSCSHRKHAVVCQWLHPISGAWLRSSPALNMLEVDYKKQQRVAKFFCGAAPVASAHHSMLAVPYSQRRCHLCSTTDVGHEQHLVLQCPAVQHIRLQHSALNFHLSSLSAFLSYHTHVAQLYHFIAAVMVLALSVPFQPP